MAITPLPEATIHLLSSAQALTTPLSLVKELIDNALDAKSTSVDILISANTLDKIEVRDNGHGITEEDLDALGRRGHTSKLRSFEELRTIGGVSLGFRGEALASAVQLGEVSVTTRTEGDPVATTVKLKAPGGIDQRTRTSHAVGTTVCVKNFLSKIPVRKQTALKAAPKTLVKVKELVQSYALARPWIRFGLKVVPAGKISWSFAPRPNDGIREAAMQVIGRDAALQCIERTLEFPDKATSNANDAEDSPTPSNSDSNLQAQNQPSKHDHLTVEVFLPKPDANPSKIGHGQYLSIDSRPVSHEKGTMKKIVSVFKFYVKESVIETSEKIPNPFLRLNIKCPLASYDPNVEPAKDNVLFGNEYLILESIEKLFKDVYGNRKPTVAIAPSRLLSKKLDNFELLLTRNPPPQPAKEPSAWSGGEASPDISLDASVSTTILTPATAPNSNQDHHETPLIHPRVTEERSDHRRGKWGFDMSRDLNEIAEDPRSSSRTNKSRVSEPSDPEKVPPLNPWLIAKMNAPVRQRRSEPPDTSSNDLRPVSRVEPSLPPTPRRSSDPPAFNSDAIVVQSPPARPRQTFRADYINSLVVCDRRFHPDSQVRRQAASVDTVDGFILERGINPGPPARRRDFVSARNFQETSLLSPPTTQNQSAPRRSRGPNNPFVSPSRTVENPVSRDGLRQTSLRTDYQPSLVQHNSNQDRLQSEPNPDLAWAMQFEHQKEEASRQRREELRAARNTREAAEMQVMFSPANAAPAAPKSSPHKNRYNAAIVSLEAGNKSSVNKTPANELFKTSLPDGDPRAYLMRRKNSMSLQPAKPGEPPRPMRAKSTKLPLERIPEKGQIHDLVFTLRNTLNVVQRTSFALAKEDTYISRGSQAAGLVMTAADTPELVRKIQAVAMKWADTGDGKKYEFEYDFGNLLKVKGL